MSNSGRAKTSPLRATVPLACATKQGSGLRSPGALLRGILVSPPRETTGSAPIRRTASLDAIYLKGLFPRENVPWQRDRATQTERATSLESLQSTTVALLEERVARMGIRGIRRKDEKSDGGRNLLKNSSSVKSSRNSEEGLNQELELYASAEPLQCDRLQQPTPEGRKAPVAELIRERPYSGTLLLPTNQNSSEDSQGSSPDQDHLLIGSSPQINRFSSRAPPDGCERVLSKSVPLLRPIPRELVTSPQPSVLFTLKPSCHSAFEQLRKEAEMEEERGIAEGEGGDEIPTVPEH